MAIVRGLRADPDIAGYLQELAVKNEAELMRRELRIARRRGAEPRGIDAALSSARDLALTASSIASMRGDLQLRKEDIRRAHRIRFCQFWPFCKK